MTNFDNLKQYILPSDLLLDMLNIYKLIGKNSIYEESLKKNINSIENATLERDVYFLSLLLNINVTDNRLRLIITKNSTPRNNDERIVKGIKTVLTQIKASVKQYDFNSSDLLSYINTIYGEKFAKFSTSMVKGDRRKRIPDQSLRLKINNVLDDYHVYFEKELYERIFLSLMAYTELININPFTKGNEVASLLALYYMILRCEVDCFRYNSFYETLYENYEAFKKEEVAASMNYREGFVQIFGLARFIYNLIDKSYTKLEAIIKEYSHEESVNKSDNVENTIYQLPNIFTKDDIRSAHPFVSEATINRILVKLRDEEYITPLGKGRSAKWIKTQKNGLNYNQPIRFNPEDDDLPF